MKQQGYQQLINCLVLTSLLTQGLCYYSETRSNLCNNKCIGKGNIFCPSSDHTSGYCCSTNELSSCLKQSTICSSDTKFGNLKLWACPNERQCGSESYAVSLSADSQVKSISLEKKYEDFLVGDICKYQIMAPSYFASNGDLVKLKVLTLSRAEAWAYIGPSYSNIQQEIQLSQGQQITATYPNQIFIVFIAQKIFVGDFSLEAYYQPIVQSSTSAQLIDSTVTSSTTTTQVTHSTASWSEKYKTPNIVAKSTPTSLLEKEKSFILNLDHNKVVVGIVAIFFILITLSLSMIALIVIVSKTKRVEISPRITIEQEEVSKVEQQKSKESMEDVKTSKFRETVLEREDEEVKKEERNSNRVPQKGSFLPDINAGKFDQKVIVEFLSEFQKMHNQLNAEEKAELEGKFGTNNFMTFVPANENQVSLQDHEMADEEVNQHTENDEQFNSSNVKILKDELLNKNNSMEGLRMQRHTLGDAQFDSIHDVREEEDYKTIRSSQIGEDEEENKIGMRLTSQQFFYPNDQPSQDEIPDQLPINFFQQLQNNDESDIRSQNQTAISFYQPGIKPNKVIQHELNDKQSLRKNNSNRNKNVKESQNSMKSKDEDSRNNKLNQQIESFQSNQSKKSKKTVRQTRGSKQYKSQNSYGNNKFNEVLDYDDAGQLEISQNSDE